MEINKQICQSCVESTYYTSVRPRFCMACGQSFAVFADKTNSIANKVIAKASSQSEAPELDREDEEPLYSGNLKPASFYRNKVKKSFEDSDDGDDDKDELKDDGSDDRGGDAGLRASSVNQTNILDFFSNSHKKNTGVKFTDIIRPEPSLPNDPAKPVKSKTAKAPSSKTTGAKRGRPAKKT